VSSGVPIGQFLVDAGHIDHGQLAVALAHQQKTGGRLGDALVALKYLGEPLLLRELARKHSVPFVEIGERRIPDRALRAVPEKLVRARRILPVAVGQDGRHEVIFVATTEPQNLSIQDEVAFVSGMAVKPVLVADRDVDGAIERIFGSAKGRMTTKAGEPLSAGDSPREAAAKH
jgi:Type II secretion system (T2SS), protein E, N-terminal domain